MSTKWVSHAENGLLIAPQARLPPAFKSRYQGDGVSFYRGCAFGPEIHCGFRGRFYRRKCGNSMSWRLTAWFVARLACPGFSLTTTKGRTSAIRSNSSVDMNNTQPMNSAVLDSRHFPTQVLQITTSIDPPLCQVCFTPPTTLSPVLRPYLKV